MWGLHYIFSVTCWWLFMLRSPQRAEWGMCLSSCPSFSLLKGHWSRGMLHAAPWGPYPASPQPRDAGLTCSLHCPSPTRNILFSLFWCSIHCVIHWRTHIFLLTLFQSLKSDEEAENSKETQNELFEAQGNAMASYLVFSAFDQGFENSQRAGSLDRAQPQEFLGKCMLWVVFLVDPFCKSSQNVGIKALRWSLGPQLPLRSDPEAEATGQVSNMILPCFMVWEYW